MAKILTKNSFTTGVTPSGLSAGELAVNVSDKKIFIGNAVEGVVTLHDQNNVVTSVNGATGAITNVAKTDVAQTFTQLQDFSAGISASYLETSTNGYVITDVLQGKSNDDISVIGTTDAFSGLYTKGTQFEEITTVWAGSNYDSDTITSAKINLTNSDTNNKTQINLKVINFDGINNIGVTAASIVLSNPYAQETLNGKIELYSTDTTTIESANGLSVLSGATFTGNISAPNIVTSVNGATGAVTNINAASVTVTNSNSSSTVYPLFAFGVGNTAIYADITTTPFSYVPSTGTLNGRIFNGTFGASQVAKLDAQALALTINDGTDLATITNISNAHNGVNSYTVSSNVGLTLYGPSIAFSAPSFYYKFPTSVGSNGQILTTNGLSNATLSWTSTLPEIISFEKGISASNATTSNVIDVVAPNDGCGLRVAQATTGSTSRVGAVRLGRSTTNSSNIYLEGYVGSFRVYNGISGTLSGNAGTKMLDLNTTSADFGVSISGVTFTGLVRSTAGICANAAITGGSYFSSESGYRVGSSTINAKTGTTYSLLSSDDGKIITISNSATHTLTVPSGLPIGFNCTVIQLGTGGVGITSSGTTLNSFNSKYTLAGQHAAVSIISYLTDTFNIAGGLTT